VGTPNGTLIRDSLEYVPPLGFLGVLADRIFISKDLDRVFAFRHEVTLKALG
jgi:ligand-binding SRPBCC domain-containing protein